MKRLLLIEDQVNDTRKAAETAESIGFEEIDAHRTVRGAMLSLERSASGQAELPDAIILDLDLGTESGYELLRFWHSTPALSRIPVIVWSVIEEQREVCELFKVNFFVSKWEGAAALRQALSKVAASAS